MPGNNCTVFWKDVNYDDEEQFEYGLTERLKHMHHTERNWNHKLDGEGTNKTQNLMLFPLTCCRMIHNWKAAHKKNKNW